MRVHDSIVLLLDLVTWVSIMEVFRYQSRGDHAAALCYIIAGAITLAASRIIEDKFRE